MPTLKSIRKRITSVKNTQKVTKVMKMIAASRLRKAQAAALNARSYHDHLQALALSIAARRESSGLLAQPDELKTIEVLVITSDRGLCGGFNSNLMRKFRDHLQPYTARGVTTRVTMIGRKGRDIAKNQKLMVDDFLADIYANMNFKSVAPAAEAAIARFVAGETQQLLLVYNRFKSVISQDNRIDTLLPVQLPETSSTPVDYLYEPSAEAVFEQVMKRSIIMQVYQAALESIASEMAARMTAMDSATKNATEMMDALTMQYNRARQAFITKELMDIVNGTESMKK